MDTDAKLFKSFEKVFIEAPLLIPRCKAIQRAYRLKSKGCEQTLLCIQHIVRVAERGKRHDKGERDEKFHVQLQVADDQHVPDKKILIIIIDQIKACR